MATRRSASAAAVLVAVALFAITAAATSFPEPTDQPSPPESRYLQLRLVGGRNTHEGRLEVSLDGREWGTVCDDAFDWYDAIVACYELGFEWRSSMWSSRAQNGSLVHYFPPADNSMAIGWSGVECSGNELTLLDCPNNGWLNSTGCTRSEDVALFCPSDPYPPPPRPPAPANGLGEEGDVRVVGGPTPLEGRVELFHNGQWGTVCGKDGPNDRYNARVVCRMIGASATGAIGTNSSAYGYGTGPFSLTGVYCGGSERRLTECEHDGFDVPHNCTHEEDFAVMCFQGPPPPSPPPTPPPRPPAPPFPPGAVNGSLRLNSMFFDTPKNAGRLEVLYNGIWGSVCDDGFGPISAEVACRLMGLPWTQATYECCSSLPYGGSSRDTPTWLDEVDCQGNETSLEQCTRQPVGKHDCTKSEDVIVYCRGLLNYPPSPPPSPPRPPLPPAVDGSLRLVGGLPEYPVSGRLEVFYNNTWGTICVADLEWSNIESMVACRQMGYAAGTWSSWILAEDATDSIPLATGTTWLNRVLCNGPETSLLECRLNRGRGWGVTGCPHTKDVIVICEADAPPPDNTPPDSTPPDSALPGPAPTPFPSPMPGSYASPPSYGYYTPEPMPASEHDHDHGEDDGDEGTEDAVAPTQLGRRSLLRV